MNKRTLLAIALTLPILALAATAWMKSTQRSSGAEVALPIEGFDPRDLLSGHYLIYQVDYGLENLCAATDVATAVCLQPERLATPADSVPADCKLFIRGYCDSSANFNAGIERFYIPEEHAAVLENKVRDKRGTLVLSVDPQGTAVIRDLLIDGQPWQEAVKVPD